jgi:hypothetical protein
VTLRHTVFNQKPHNTESHVPGVFSKLQDKKPEEEEKL